MALLDQAMQAAQGAPGAAPAAGGAPVPPGAPAPGPGPATAPGGAPAPGPAPGGPVPGGAQAPGGEQDPKAQLNEAMRIASNALYNETVFNSMVDQMNGKFSIEVMAGNATLILTETEKVVGQLSLENFFALAVVIVVDACDALASSGMEVSDQDVYEALGSTIEMFLQQNQGRWSKEELEAGVKSLEEAQANADQLAADFGGPGEPMGGGAPAPGGPAPGGPAAAGGLLKQGSM